MRRETSTDWPVHSAAAFGGTGDSFLKTLRRNLDDVPTRNVLVFVHGFNVTLEAAVARAAQVAEDMPFDGPVIAFSWHSQGQTEAYLADERSAEHQRPGGAGTDRN